ncbi:hypothetical protein DPMN_078304 [Dreissena polymorpha]|uniref:Uncharacterized protein n=1 Tax=Dreissena polymorpha TaxID=45954 RepID=A0A9D3YMF8_DREPO|nr:hypothetical protein DPMN_078304 [Dreissena polymorpha]
MPGQTRSAKRGLMKNTKAEHHSKTFAIDRPHPLLACIQCEKAKSDSEPPIKEEQRTASKHLALRSGFRCRADWQEVGTTGETCQELRRIKEANRRPITKRGPQGNIR